MKPQYLFLFPIKEYIEFSMFVEDVPKAGHTTEYLMRIIEARYRSKGYDVNWLLFSEHGDLANPDRAAVPPYVEIKPEDRVLVAGVSFETHTTKKVYADLDFVLNQLPEHRRLVVGGFHMHDCVDRIAKRSYEKGADTFVDEDTTEKFYHGMPLGAVPLVREVWRVRDFLPPKFQEQFKDTAMLGRSEKPWLTQEW
ncbi:MAG TPA: hypothetical protein VI933_01545 [archaeon]|nr:hypothetical protein [archaeon]